MSGADVPYQLRPNKFIDRQMFVEMLTRLIIPRGPEKYIYVSMGGRHLVDHYAVYNRLGIRAQFSFDSNKNEVARQKFNKPTGVTVCEEMVSSALPTEIDSILQRFPSKRNLIVWLDYTKTDRKSQLQEAVQTLIRLKHGDVFRITLNANPQTLCAGEEWKAHGAPNPAVHRADKLRSQISEFLPTDVSEIKENEMPEVLARCVQLAASTAEGLKAGLSITPLFVTSYKDSTRMLTVTCAVSENGKTETFPGKLFSRWKFISRKWTDIHTIAVPVLSPKEQYRLDAKLHHGPKRMLSSLPFLPAPNEAASLAALKSYSSFHRYYPSFRHVDD